MDETSVLSAFSPLTRGWFRAAFSAPTPVQRDGWAAIARGDHALLLAPTGSGKTLAAFLWCLDRVAVDRPPAVSERCRVLYISPLKALSYDVERNLMAPLAGLDVEARRLGIPPPDVRVATRTGDTPAAVRRDLVRHPPDILITTPESLYLMLTSRARAVLAGVRWVIVDEIHAVAGTKRGSHLALSLERLEHLVARAHPHAPELPVGGRYQRIGLSATQRPLEELARFLGGVGRHVTVVDASQPKPLDLQVVVPVEDMAALGQLLPADQQFGGALEQLPEVRTSIWPSVQAEILQLVRAHRTTLVFVNSRRLAERMAASLNELHNHERELAAREAGLPFEEETLAYAHHGSVARERRQFIEEQLKAGRVRAIVATSSLELGIDMGAIDLVIQVESPPSVASGLQRVGRAGHQVDAVSAARIFPKYRGDLLKAAVVVQRMREGLVETTAIPRNPLDVLAQQIVAATVDQTWSIADLEAMIRRAYPFAELAPEVFEAVLDMLAGRYPSDEFAELKPRIVWDRVAGTVTARSDARAVAVTSGGTIPDRGLFPVVLGEGGPRIGELDEEMVYEARPGETFVLGASTWRIEAITPQRVIVQPAPGEPGKMPFWHGDGLGCPVELGRAIGAFIREVSARGEAEAREYLARWHHLDGLAAANLVRYLAEEREAVGALPTDRTVVVERFRDELGDWRVCILTPFGGRLHAPWALALEARLRERLGSPVQAIWSDDGIAIRLPEAELNDLAGFALIDPDELEELVVRALGASALFATRFRENAARALLLPRRRPNVRTPLWLQRQRSADLLRVASRYGSFPIILETYRECLRDVFDLAALQELLRRLASREVRLHAVDLAAPSPFASSLLFNYIAEFMYEGDAPLAERRAQALTLDRNLLRELLGDAEVRELLDPEAIAEVELDLQRLAEARRARNPDQLHDLLRRLGDLTDQEVAARCAGPAGRWLGQLVAERRIVSVRIAGQGRWIAVEDVGRYRDAVGIAPPPGVANVHLEAVERPLEGLLARYARSHVPFRTREPAERFGLPLGVVAEALDRMAGAGALLAGEFLPDHREREWCDPEVLRVLKRRSLARLRREIEPVPPECFARFLLRWHGVGGDASGVDRLAEVVAQLEGCAVPTSVLERHVLASRVAGYQPRMLDDLCASGEVVWIGRGALPGNDGRVALYRRDRLAVLRPEPINPPDSDLHTRVRDYLASRGASFFREIHLGVGGGPERAVLDALWDLVWAGEVTNDTLAPLRALRHRRGGNPAGPPRRAPRLTRLGPPDAAGRWSLLRTHTAGSVAETQRLHTLAAQLLDRYGVVTRESALAEGIPGGFAALYPVLKALEETGRIRRGYFIDGFGGAQFALPGAVDRLRAERDTAEAGRALVLAATDPASPYGASLPWPTADASERRIMQRVAGAFLVLVDGLPVLYLRRVGPSRARLLTLPPFQDANRAIPALQALGAEAGPVDGRGLTIEEIDGVRALESPLRARFEEAGFQRDYLGLRIRPGPAPVASGRH